MQGLRFVCFDWLLEVLVINSVAYFCSLLFVRVGCLVICLRLVLLAGGVREFADSCCLLRCCLTCRWFVLMFGYSFGALVLIDVGCLYRLMYLVVLIFGLLVMFALGGAVVFGCCVCLFCMVLILGFGVFGGCCVCVVFGVCCFGLF